VEARAWPPWHGAVDGGRASDDPRHRRNCRLESINKQTVVVAAFLGAVSFGAESATFMDAAWASQLCQAWNKNPTLTGKLGGDS